jgi:hypothetical protein
VKAQHADIASTIRIFQKNICAEMFVTTTFPAGSQGWSIMLWRDPVRAVMKACQFNLDLSLFQAQM